MAIEIFELVIKATINESSNQTGLKAQVATPTSSASKTVKKEMAEQALELINRKNER